jgi:hypothetical protein
MEFRVEEKLIRLTLTPSKTLATRKTVDGSSVLPRASRK